MSHNPTIRMVRQHMFKVGDRVRQGLALGTITKADGNTFYNAFRDVGGMLVTVKFDDRTREVVMAEHDLTLHEVWEVQVGKGSSSYTTKYSFENDEAKALLYYVSLNTHSGHKKRLLCNGKVVKRYLS